MGIFGSSIAPPTPVGGAVLGAAPGLLGGIFNIFSARKERQFSREMWDKQNAYNTPAAQLARYKEAGINPAYGAGMASGNAAPMSNSAASVARMEFPNVLESLGQYQSIKNAEIEGQRLQQLVEGAKLDNLTKSLNNQFLSATLWDRSKMIGSKWLLTNAQADKTSTENARLLDTNKIYKDSMVAKYQLDQQRFQQNRDMFDIDLRLAQLGLDREKLGLTAGDSAFLRVLARSKTDLTPSSLMPYVIGEGLVNFGGDLLKTAMPKLPFQKLQFDYKNARGYKPYSKMPYGNY